MQLKKPLRVSTAFADYELREIIGEGGAGRVYGGIAPDGAAVAVKFLTAASADKRRRFKNEIAFLQRNREPNIVTVIDHGAAPRDEKLGPFYVMKRFDYSLRELMTRGIKPADALALFSQVLDGVEAAHFQNAVHRDLKPENILYDQARRVLAIADFGVASFTQDDLITAVRTNDAQRLANFKYAAPEQRDTNVQVTLRADIYALGLILNELFTQRVPHGTGYRPIADADADYAFLDPIVECMIRQRPEERPRAISEVKQLIMRSRADAVSLKKLSTLTNAVVDVDAVENPLAQEPPQIADVDWNDRILTIKLDRPVNEAWVGTFGNLQNYRFLMGKQPNAWRWRGNSASIRADEYEAQQVVDNFKEWLPMATRQLRDYLSHQANEQKAARERERRAQIQAEEQRLRVLRGLKF